MDRALIEPGAKLSRVLVGFLASAIKVAEGLVRFQPGQMLKRIASSTACTCSGFQLSCGCTRMVATF